MNAAARSQVSETISYLNAKTSKKNIRFRRVTEKIIENLRVKFTLSRAYSKCRTMVPAQSKTVTPKHSSRWVHRTPLLVYMYEAILVQVFDYDFSPASELAGKESINMNVSSEGVDDLSDLQAMGLILRLKLATKGHFTTTSYQVLPAGVAALRFMNPDDRLLVDRFLISGVTMDTPEMLMSAVEEHDAPVSDGRFKPFEIRYDEDKTEFTLFDSDGGERISSITDFEDVSYVCSPYLPQCLRPVSGSGGPKGRAFSDFSKLAHLSKGGVDTMLEENTFNVLLSGLRILSSQYLVNGPNEVNALHEKLSLHASREELKSGQAGLVSAHVDHSPASATFDVAMSGMCALFPMDYVRSKMANFESKVYLPEDPGVVQLENFGIHVHANGEVIFGVRVESVMSYVKDNLPVDLIARLVFDLHEDSASTLESISSAHQRLLMSSLFKKTTRVALPPDINRMSTSGGNNAADLGLARSESKPVKTTMTRFLSQKLFGSTEYTKVYNKVDAVDEYDSPEVVTNSSGGEDMIPAKYQFNMFTAFLVDNIEPKVPVHDLLDGEDAENDISQIVGRINDAADLPDGGVVVSGEKGLIVSGEIGKKFEQLIMVHTSVMSRRIFVSTFFHRLYEMEADIDSIQEAISSHIGKPSGLAEIRRRVMEACKQASLLDSLLTQAQATSSDMPDISAATAIEGQSDPAYAIMLETLHTTEYRDELIVRLKDLESLLQCARLGLSSLRENTDVISEMQMFKLQESLQSNTRNLESLFRSNESASSSLEIMQLVIGGSLGFTILDRVTGEWSLLDTEWGRSFFTNFVDPPGVWFVISMLFFVVIVITLQFAMRSMLRRASADMCMRYSLHVGINVQAMRRMLRRHELFSEEADTDIEGNNMYKVSWHEPAEDYGGSPLKVEISVDQGHARLCTLNLKYNRQDGQMSVPEVQDRFFKELVDAGVVINVAELGGLVRPAERPAEENERAAKDVQWSKARLKMLRSKASQRTKFKNTEQERLVRMSQPN